MDFRIAMFIVSLVTFFTYVPFIWIKYGVQTSISDSYYALQKDNLGYLFTLFCFLFAYPLAMVAGNIFVTPAAMLICLVGVARGFKDSKVLKIAHMFGAYTGVALSQIGIWVSYDMWYVTLAFIGISGLLFILDVKDKIWWVEILAFGSIIGVLATTL